MLRRLIPAPQRAMVIVHDLFMTAAAVMAAFYFRFEEIGLTGRLAGILTILPFFVVYAGGVYWFFQLYRAKWRFASLPDLKNILRAASVLALTLLVLDYVLVSGNVYGGYFFGKITILLYWFLQIFFLGGTRIAYRAFRQARTQQHATISGATPTLILGRAADTEVLLRAIESGAVQKITPVGILSPSTADLGQSLRGVPVLGPLDSLEDNVAALAARGTQVTRLVLTSEVLKPEFHPEEILMKARRLGLATSQLPSLDSQEAPRLAPIDVEHLLLRPSVSIDYDRLEGFIAGQSVVVTGGGGSIGSEICDRVITFGARRLLVIENSEPALHAVLEKLRVKAPAAEILGRIADVRDRDRIFRLFAEFKADIVFHAAALKHVPILEQDWGEGVKTNVFGSIHVADAAAASGVAAMVMISTDKAIEPVSMLGATKRFAEMYCQALDAEFVRKAGAAKPSMRLIAVRFGNVLASNGSVVPKFKAQIEAGGPITVTHQDMVRYFMTIREACDLVVMSASHAVEAERADASVYVLNMGQPVKIVDLAERMIRLSGLEPGRDIDIVFTGIRPGERLNEILFAREEPSSEIGIPGIVAARPVYPALDVMRDWIVNLEQGLVREERGAIYAVMRDAVPDFRGEAA